MMIKRNQKFFVDTEENKVTIKLEKLLHTRSWSLKEEICIAGLKKGNFEAEIHIVAEEIKTVQKQSLKIIVE